MVLPYKFITRKMRVICTNCMSANYTYEFKVNILSRDLLFLDNISADANATQDHKKVYCPKCCAETDHFLFDDEMYDCISNLFPIIRGKGDFTVGINYACPGNSVTPPYYMSDSKQLFNIINNSKTILSDKWEIINDRIIRSPQDHDKFVPVSILTVKDDVPKEYIESKQHIKELTEFTETIKENFVNDIDDDTETNIGYMNIIDFTNMVKLFSDKELLEYSIPTSMSIDSSDLLREFSREYKDYNKVCVIPTNHHNAILFIVMIWVLIYKQDTIFIFKNAYYKEILLKLYSSIVKALNINKPVDKVIDRIIEYNTVLINVPIVISKDRSYQSRLVITQTLESRVLGNFEEFITKNGRVFDFNVYHKFIENN